MSSFSGGEALILTHNLYRMSKLPNVGTTIFTVMSKMAVEHKAINLAQGFPNFSIDEKLNEALRISSESLLHQYAPMPGTPKLLAAISQMNEERYHTYFNPDSNILVTAGATQAIFLAIQTFVDEGDEVLMLDPCYDCYDPSVVLAKGTPVHVALDENYRVDWQAIKAAVTVQTRMIIINNPHNPAGTLWTLSDFEQLEALCELYPRLLVLADEVYEYITFEEDFHSIKTRTNLHHRMISVSSFGKTFHITGWKVGYLVASEHLIAEMKKVHQFLVFCVSSIAQEALGEYIPIADYPEISRLYQHKRDLFAKEMEASRFELLPCEGSFFQLASYRNISDESDLDFTRRLVEEFGVATIPTSVFYADKQDRKIIRFCFAKDDETLIESARRLCKV